MLKVVIKVGCVTSLFLFWLLIICASPFLLGEIPMEVAYIAAGISFVLLILRFIYRFRTSPEHLLRKELKNMKAPISIDPVSGSYTCKSCGGTTVFKSATEPANFCQFCGASLDEAKEVFDHRKRELERKQNEFQKAKDEKMHTLIEYDKARKERDAKAAAHRFNQIYDSFRTFIQTIIYILIPLLFFAVMVIAVIILKK